jgi:hypothetical protein
MLDITKVRHEKQSKEISRRIVVGGSDPSLKFHLGTPLHPLQSHVGLSNYTG